MNARSTRCPCSERGHIELNYDVAGDSKIFASGGVGIVGETEAGEPRANQDGSVSERCWCTGLLIPFQLWRKCSQGKVVHLPGM